jgi:hypothetical protein
MRAILALEASMMGFPSHIRNSSVFRTLASLIAISWLVIPTGCSSSSRNLQQSMKSYSEAVTVSRNTDEPPVFDVDPAPQRSEGSAPAPDSRLIAAEPAAFSWKSMGRSSGGNSFQVFQTGDAGFRSLVSGSVGGHDPLASRFMEDLARHLNSNALILGGFQTTVIKTLNPDGEKNRSLVNARGIYVNHRFPQPGKPSAGSAEECGEVRFMLDQIAELKPQRVIHVRTVKGARGVVAVSENANKTGSELSRWLDFQLMPLPGKSVQGSMERYLSSNDNIEMITFGIPDDTIETELWERFGDAVLNLMLNDDPVSREIARRQRNETSADSRNKR